MSAGDAASAPDGASTGVEPDPTTAPTLVFEKSATRHSLLEDVLGLVTGTFLVSFGLYLLQTAGAVTGGTAGLALLLGYATSWPLPLLFAIVNLPFAVLAIWKKGWDFTVRTAVAIGLVSGFALVHHAFLQLGHIDAVYGTLGGNLMVGVGVLIIFRHRASLGGINIIAIVLQERTGFRAGWTQMVFDVLIIAAGLLVVSWDKVLLSAAGAVVLNLVLAMNHRPGRYIGR